MDWLFEKVFGTFAAVAMLFMSVVLLVVMVKLVPVLFSWDPAKDGQCPTLDAGTDAARAVERE